jgi:hypothetical protein
MTLHSALQRRSSTEPRRSSNHNSKSALVEIITTTFHVSLRSNVRIIEVQPRRSALENGHNLVDLFSDLRGQQALSNPQNP